MNAIKPYTIEATALQLWLASQFADYSLPHLNDFLLLREHNGLIMAPSFPLESGLKLSAEAEALIQNEAVVYLQLGTLQLQRREGRGWRRQAQIREGSFFTLVNYRNLQGNEPQWMRMLPRTKCTVSVLSINPAFGFSWLKQAAHRHTLLSRIFFYMDPEIDAECRKTRFREFERLFKCEVFRRGTRILGEGRKNERIMFISKGEARLSKQLKCKSAQGDKFSNVDIVYVSEGTILGGELFLLSSKTIQTILAAQNYLPEQDEEQTHEEDGENKKKKKPKRKIIEAQGYTLHPPSENVSNYTIIAESANLQVFTIDIERLVAAIPERFKTGLIRLLEQSYVTLLRRTHQKMGLQLQKAEARVQRGQQSLQIISAKAFSSQRGESAAEPALEVKQSEIVATGSLGNLRRAEVQRAQSLSVEKRAALAMQKDKPKVDFKQRIEALLEAKLTHPEKDNIELVSDLADIFMKKQEGRSEDIEKRHQLISKKVLLLEKRGGWQPGWAQLSSEGPPKPEPTRYPPPIKKKQPQQSPIQHTDSLRQTNRIRQTCRHKIHETNKIKEQFMKIKSECPSCSCYDNFQGFGLTRSGSSMGRTAYKTAEGWGRASKAHLEEEPLETIYNSMRFLSEKSKQKYNHNVHLLQTRRNRDRRRSAPALA